MGHSLQNCHKKNPQQEKQAPVRQGNGQNGKQQQGFWQTQIAKRVYKQVANHNSQEAGPSGAKNAHGLEVGATQVLPTATTNTFSVLNDISEDNLITEVVDKNDRAENTNALMQTVTKDTNAGNLVSEISTDTPVDVINGDTTDSPPAVNVAEVPMQANEEGNPTINADSVNTLIPTQVINLEHSGYRSPQNRSIGSAIAEEFINFEVLTIDEEINDHAQVTPLAIEGPLMVQKQSQALFLTNGNQSEEELSEEEEEVHTEELEGHCSDLDLLTRKSKLIPPSHMCTRSKTNPHGSTKKKGYQCCRQ
ncbi:hypothetical protein FRX31_020078 [Thalictrum thalictroides]|uniref:Uncharacterized protein n=1 Tax=Thalictrum thalictroides TaxID=46969 RepID=A0A7J6VYY3_THATH|nr:hypothetical protein FRX31_020078 [Thalictrum thalictroides]